MIKVPEMASPPRLPAQEEAWQHRHRPSAASRSSNRARRAVAQEPIAPRAEATDTMARH